MKYRLCLDYDNVSEHFIGQELLNLHLKFPKYEFYPMKSSENCYHIKSAKLMNWENAIQILNFARCSTAYKNYCRRIKAFPIRLSEKYCIGETVKEIKPKPYLL